MPQLIVKVCAKYLEKSMVLALCEGSENSKSRKRGSKQNIKIAVVGGTAALIERNTA
jgi:hypothetical protein